MKRARQLESVLDSGSHTGDTRRRDLDQARHGQEKADKSNLDSQDTKYRKDFLNTITVEQRR